MESNLKRSERIEKESAEYAKKLTRVDNYHFTRSDIENAYFLGAANEYSNLRALLKEAFEAGHKILYCDGDMEFNYKTFEDYMKDKDEKTNTNITDNN